MKSYGVGFLPSNVLIKSYSSKSFPANLLINLLRFSVETEAFLLKILRSVKGISLEGGSMVILLSIDLQLGIGDANFEVI